MFTVGQRVLVMWRDEWRSATVKAPYHDGYCAGSVRVRIDGMAYDVDLLTYDVRAK